MERPVFEMVSDTSPLLRPRVDKKSEGTKRPSVTERNVSIKKPPVKRTLCAASSALLFIVAVAMTTAYSAPATVDMNREGSRFESVTSEQIAWIASLASLTAIIGNVLSGYLSQKFGRKGVLLYMSLPHALGWLIIAYAPNIESVYAGRAICGVCMGVCFAAAPAYIVEVASLEQRGMLATGFQVAFATGVLIVMTFGIFLRWSWLAVTGASIVTAGAILLYFMPESPHWLVANSMYQEALSGLEFLRLDREVATEELQELFSDQKTEEPELTVKELFTDPALYKPFSIGVALMFFQQACGINALMSYLVELLDNPSTTFAVDASLSSAIVALAQVLSTGLSGLLMDRVGRRFLYILSGVCMTLSLIGSGCYSYFSHHGRIPQDAWNWVPLASFLVYIVSFALGFGPVPMVVAPELVPTRSRGLVLAAASVSGSVFSFLVTKTFNDLRSLVGLYGTYWTYGGFSLLGSLFYWMFVPETKGRTIRDINREFSRSTD